MAAPQTSARGRKPSLAVASNGPRLGSAQWAADQTECTYRQVDYWIRKGLMGTALAAVGPGNRRRLDDADLELLVALRHLASLGAIDQWLRLAAGAVRTGRVRPGEWLTVTLAGGAFRHPNPFYAHVDGPHWSVPLTAFDGGRPCPLPGQRGGEAAVAESRPLPASSGTARPQGRAT